jgi:hypothetical protein
MWRRLDNSAYDAGHCTAHGICTAANDNAYDIDTLHQQSVYPIKAEVFSFRSKCGMKDLLDFDRLFRNIRLNLILTLLATDGLAVSGLTKALCDIIRGNALSLMKCHRKHAVDELVILRPVLR